MKITHEDCGDGTTDIAISSEPKAFDNVRRWAKESNLMGQTALESVQNLGYRKIRYDISGQPGENEGAIDGSGGHGSVVYINVDNADIEESLKIIQKAKTDALALYATMTDPATYID